MVEPDEDTFHEYFCTVGSGLENFLADELQEIRSNSVQMITAGKVYFSSNLPPEALLSLKTAERLFIMVRRESQFLINRTKRDAISRFRTIVENECALDWNRCLNKWKEFYSVLSSGECGDTLKFRVSCKCSGKIKNVFPSFFLGKILAGSLLNIHPKWIPELRNPQLEVLLHSDMNSLTLGLACCLFNQPLSKRPYLSEKKGQAILRPTLCSAMLALALKTGGVAPSVSNRNTLKEPVVLLDPMCGTGMILAEAAAFDELADSMILLGSDSDVTQVNEAIKNVERAESMKKTKLNHGDQTRRMNRCSTHLFVGDARALPLQNDSVHCIVSDLPFGLKHTCKPWSKHLREVVTKEHFNCGTFESSINSKREVNDQCHKGNSDDEREEKITPKAQTGSGSLLGETIIDGNETRQFNGDEVACPKRRVKRKNPYAASAGVKKTAKVDVECSTIEDAKHMLPEIIIEMDRVLIQGGRVVLIISETLKPSLLEAVDLVTSPTNPLTCCSDCKKSTDTSWSEHFHSGDCTFESKPTTSNLTSRDSNQKSSYEMGRLGENDIMRSKRRGWSCTKEHKVRLGILDAVICVFST